MSSRAAGTFGVALCVVAGAFGVPALLLPGIALFVLAVLAWVSVALPYRTLELMGPRRATVREGEEVAVTLRLRGGPLPLLGGELITDSEVRWLGLRVSRERRLRVSTRPPRRGRHVLGWGRLRCGDPFGLCVRERPAPETEVLVLPRVERIRGAGFGGARGGAATGRRALAGTEPELDTLRALPPDSPASMIHWPTVARTGTLMGRTGREGGGCPPLVVVDPHGAASEEALDRALRAAASLCVRLATTGGCSLLLPDERRPRAIAPSLVGWPEAHARLALVSRESALAAAPVQHAGRLLWVCAWEGGVPESLRRSHAAGRCLISPFPLASRPTGFTVAGCSGQWLGSA